MTDVVKANTLYFIILDWAISVNCGVWWKEDEMKGALNTHYLSFGIQTQI